MKSSLQPLARRSFSMGLLSRSTPPAKSSPNTVKAVAWAVYDSTLGSFLLGKNEYKPREIASLTKVMKLFVTLRLTKRYQQDLDEVVTVSAEAGRIGGTSAGLRPGVAGAGLELLRLRAGHERGEDHDREAQVRSTATHEGGL